MSKLLNTGPSLSGWHRLQNVLECPQKYSYRYNLGIEASIPAVALMRGSLAHLGLAHHYLRKQLEDNGEDKDQWLNPYDAMRLQSDNEPEYKEVLTDIEDAVEAYQRHWKVIDQKWKVLEVEKQAYSAIPDKNKVHLLTGRFDMVLENENGDVYIVDHKTTSRLTNNHEKYYSMSGQLLGYEYMARHIYGDRLKGVMLNLIQIRPPYKFKRLILHPRPNLSAQFEQTVIDAENLISLYSTRDPMHYPKAMNELTCFHRYGACDYIDLCKFGVCNG